MTAVRRLRSLGVVAGVLLAACAAGSGDDAGPGTTASTTSSSTTVVFTGDADSEFCRLLAESDERSVLDPFEAGIEPAEVELRFRALQVRFGEFADVAPPELAGDIDALVEALDDLGRQLEAVGYDFAALAETDPDVALFDDESFAEASDRLAAYGEQVCEF